MPPCLDAAAPASALRWASSWCRAITTWTRMAGSTETPSAIDADRRPDEPGRPRDDRRRLDVVRRRRRSLVRLSRPARRPSTASPSGRRSSLLSHNPDYAESDPDPRVGLMLSGHTHGGQVYLPIVGAPWVPSAYGAKYLSGLVQGPATQVYVTRGIGEAAIPVRFNCPPEINLLTLTRPRARNRPRTRGPVTGGVTGRRDIARLQQCREMGARHIVVVDRRFRFSNDRDVVQHLLFGEPRQLHSRKRGAGRLPVVKGIASATTGSFNSCRRPFPVNR